MIAIKGTRLPRNCRECPFIHHTMSGIYRCMMHRPGYLGDNMMLPEDDRPKWCPLVEVEEKE